MAATSSRNNVANNLLKNCMDVYGNISFAEANDFYWSPKKQTVFYNPSLLSEKTGQWALLHEISHGLLNHTTYGSDLELLLYEVAAWQKALEIMKIHKVLIPYDHIESCLDTYRDWLYARSTCTLCRLNSLQISAKEYKCLNCQNSWQVSSSRFCRPYRMKMK